MRVAVVGSGPAGFYAAGALLSADPPAEVDLLERLPTPWGLVRLGVAPDHPKLKTVSRAFERIADRPGFRFLGNVEVGRDLTHDDLVRLYDADPDRIAVVAPGVDLSMFQPIDREEARQTIGYGQGRLLLFVGRLERLKGVEVAIRALALLRDRAHDDVRLLILVEDSRDGEESEKERLKAIATGAGVRDHVDFLGSVAHHELPFFYSAADVCVMPSYSESFGLVGLEAQACGRPVVGSGVAGLRSVVRDEVTGYLIDSHDPALYAERIGRLLDNPELAQQMGRHGRLLAQRFSWNRTADRLQTLFERVIERAQVRVQANARHE